MKATTEQEPKKVVSQLYWIWDECIKINYSSIYCKWYNNEIKTIPFTIASKRIKCLSDFIQGTYGLCIQNLRKKSWKKLKRV